MPTVMKQGNRRCDAICHDARKEKCTCICGGKNHGKGFEQAKQNVIEMSEERPEMPAQVISHDLITGASDTRGVIIAGRRLDPSRSQKVWNHSPDGFNWGYGGSGPAQLALAILLELGVPEQRAVELHQSFKFEVIAGLEKNFAIPVADVRTWIEKQRDRCQICKGTHPTGCCPRDGHGG